MTANHYDAIIVVGGVSGDKSPTQSVEALRADRGVGFSRLPRNEAGL
jgi:hypothetical protein